MDAVLKRVYDALEKEGGMNMLLALGDHGMTAVGSHGGSSHLETSVPLIWLPSGGANKKSAQTQPSVPVQQVDVAVTISLLLGLPTPAHSIGVPLLPVLRSVGFSELQVRIPSKVGRNSSRVY